MSHSYSRKNKYKYRYYICLNAIKLNRQACPTKSISAAAIEEKCLELLMRITKDERFEDSNWKTIPLEEQMAVINELVREIDYDGGKSKLRIYLKGDVRKYEYDLPIDELKKKLPAISQPDFKSEPVIRQQLLLANQIQQMLDSGRAKDLHQIAEWLGLSKTRLEQLTNLLLLCPKIQEDIICGNPTQFSGVTERTVRSIYFEMDWQKQIEVWKNLST